MTGFPLFPATGLPKRTVPYAVVEELACAEHARWAKWQAHLHGRCIRNPDGSLTIPADLVARWERQIATPYAELTEREKDSDREQVAAVLPILTKLLNS
jgi:hypothetical protein